MLEAMKGSMLGFLALIVCLTILGNPTAAADVTPRVGVTQGVIIREEARSSSVQLGVLRPGERLTFVSSVPRWHQVLLDDGGTGFVSKRWTTLINVDQGLADFEIHFLDVGTGDSAIVDLGDREIVVDGGNSVRVLHDYAESTGIIQDPIELVVVTHGDSDHWKGLTRLLGFDGRATRSFNALEYWDAGYDRDCRRLASYDAFLSSVEAISNLRFLRPLSSTHTPEVDRNAAELNSFTLDSLPGVTFTILHSDPAPTASDCAYRINNASIVMMVEIDGIRILFTGDANGKERAQEGTVVPTHVEAKLLDLERRIPGTLRADILKVPHHGSETASTDEFIRAVRPRFVIISASTTHHLPRPSVVERYDRDGRIVLRTDRNHENNRDHIICGRDQNAALNCRFETDF